MLFNWFAGRRRKKLAKRPFPSAWEEFARKNVAHWCMLGEAERATLRGMIHVLLAEKEWEGAGGLELTDEIKVTIAAQASLLILNLPHDYYRNVLSIIVYPSTVLPPPRAPGFFETTLAPVDVGAPLLGQAFQQGPVILVWDAVLASGRHPERGHNVVYHEFAHKLDMLDGSADGTPPLAGRKEYGEWVEVCSREYLALKAAREEGRRTFLDDYGGSNEAEFFAVATEEFFDRPQELRDNSPDLYRVLMEYYRQDPALRVSGGCPLPTG